MIVKECVAPKQCSEKFNSNWLKRFKAFLSKRNFQLDGGGEYTSALGTISIVDSGSCYRVRYTSSSADVSSVAAELLREIEKRVTEIFDLTKGGVEVDTGKVIQEVSTAALVTTGFIVAGKLANATSETNLAAKEIKNAIRTPVGEAPSEMVEGVVAGLKDVKQTVVEGVDTFGSAVRDTRSVIQEGVDAAQEVVTKNLNYVKDSFKPELDTLKSSIQKSDAIRKAADGTKSLTQGVQRAGDAGAKSINKALGLTSKATQVTGNEVVAVTAITAGSAVMSLISNTRSEMPALNTASGERTVLRVESQVDPVTVKEYMANPTGSIGITNIKGSKKLSNTGEVRLGLSLENCVNFVCEVNSENFLEIQLWCYRRQGTKLVETQLPGKGHQAYKLGIKLLDNVLQRWCKMPSFKDVRPNPSTISTEPDVEEVV